MLECYRLAATLYTVARAMEPQDLGGHAKTGHVWPPENRPYERRPGQGFLLLQSSLKQQAFGFSIRMRSA